MVLKVRSMIARPSPFETCSREDCMLYHLVLINFKPEATQIQKDAVKAALDRLPALIPDIKAYKNGFDIIGSDRSYEFGLYSAFEDLDAMGRYQAHPEHQKALGLIREAAASIVAVDYYA